MHHGWPVKKSIVNLPSRIKENLNVFPVNFESVGSQNKDLGAASQILLMVVKLHL